MGTTLNGTDSLYGSQWYLQKLALPGQDITKIWKEYDGTGTHTAVYDDGLQSTHEDLKGNYDATRELTVGGVKSNPLAGAGVHGTAVAGIIGAQANDGVGGVGVAMGTKITGVDVFSGSASGSGMITAIRAMSGFDTVNNSWNWTGKYADPTSVSGSFGQQFSAALKFAADTGRGGLGTIIVDSAGNDWLTDRRDANTSEFAQSRHTVTVGAVTDSGDVAYYANRGADLLISAPTSGGSQGMVTTDRTGSGGYDAGNYTSTFGGTSGAAPVITAVADLMLNANPDLGWRDVQDIMAVTAMRTVGSLSGGLSGNMAFGWTINHANDVNGGGMHFSNDVGYGSVNAFEAVREAEVWSNFGAARTSANEQHLTASATVNKTIADNSATSFAMNVGQNVKMEHVDLTLTLTHGNVNDLRIELVSPSGTNSVVLTPGSGAQISQTNWTWSLGSEAFHGELSAGNWTVKVTDLVSGNTGTVASAKLDVYGEAVTANDAYHFTGEWQQMFALDATRAVVKDTNGGIDWVDAAVLTGNVNLDLHAGAQSTVNGVNFVKIDAAAQIENAVTGDGNDTLSGNDLDNKLMGMRGNDTLEGYGGADTLDGGQGVDTATYLHSTGAVDLDLTRAVQIGAHAQGDTLVSVENLTGSNFDDVLRGDAGANVLDGGAGNDVLEGRGGADVVVGGAGVNVASYEHSATAVDVDLTRAVQHGGDAEGDTLSGIRDILGSAFADRLIGDARDNTFYGGGGNDWMEGGAGIDTVDYSKSAAAVSLVMTNAYQSGGDAQGDHLVSIEHVIGTAFNDRIVGTAAAETFDGGVGHDYLDGGAGVDVLNGGLGDDTVIGGAGRDVLNGGDGVDTADYTASVAAVTVNLAAGIGQFGDAEGDTLVSVENVMGSLNGANTLLGSSAVNVLTGGNGNDYLDGGAGNDRLFGGAGADRLLGGDGDDYLHGGIGSDMLTGGAGRDNFAFDARGWGADVITDFARGQDKIDMRGLGLSFSDVRVTMSGTSETLSFTSRGIADSITMVNMIQKVDASDFLFA